MLGPARPEALQQAFACDSGAGTLPTTNICLMMPLRHSPAQQRLTVPRVPVAAPPGRGPARRWAQVQEGVWRQVILTQLAGAGKEREKAGGEAPWERRGWCGTQRVKVTSRRSSAQPARQTRGVGEGAEL